MISMRWIARTRSFKAIKIIWFFFKPYKSKLLFVSFVMFVAGSLESLNLAVLYPVINYGLEQKSEGIILGFFNKLLLISNSSNLFLSSCILLIFITIIAVGFKAINYFVSYKLMINILERYQKEVFSKYINADYEFFINHQQGKLVHTGTIASQETANMVLSAIRTVNDLISLIFLFSLLLMLTWQGALLIVIIGIFYSILVKRIMNKIIYHCGKLLAEADRDKNVILNELITGVKTIKVFFEFETWREKYHDAVERSMHNQFKMLMGRVAPESLMKLVFYIMLAGLGILINFTVKGDVVSWMPVFGTFVIVTSRLIPAAQILGSDFMNMVTSLPNSKIVYDLFHEETRMIPDGNKTLKEFNREISFKDIFFKYKSMDNYLLKGINFNIEKRKVTAIVGPSGNGKTTIINMLLRLYSANSGDISIDGVAISKFTKESFLAKIGYVSQETFIYNDTIKENIMFGMKNCTDEMLFATAKQANAHEFIINTANGYDTVVGDSGMKLSGGQRQRIAIARALLRKPEIMVLDEATSSLDNISEKIVQDAINNISKHTTVLIIAHRLSTIQNADKILVLNDGQIVEEGSHEELLRKEGEYFRLYSTQLSGN